MESLIVSFLVGAFLIFLPLWIWGKREAELTNKIDNMVGAYTATASLIAPNLHRNNDLKEYEKVIASVLNKDYNKRTTDRLSKIIMDRYSSRYDETKGFPLAKQRVFFQGLILEGVITQMECEQGKPVTPRQRRKISGIMFRKRKPEEMAGD